MATLRVKPIDHLKEKVKTIKEKLPKNFRSILLEKYPEYNTISGGTLVTNVMRFRSSDVLLTERLEEIVRESEVEQAKEKEGEVV